jgi:hypothetical protein
MSKTIKKYWRRETIAFAILGVVAIVVAAAFLSSSPTSAAGTKSKVDTPTLACAGSGQDYIDIKVTAGPTTGAPAGFSIQWMTAADFALNGSVWPECTVDPITGEEVCTFCKASFSGNAVGGNYNLGAGKSITVRIGDLLMDEGVSTTCPGDLACGTEYVFRAFAHATSKLLRSDFSANQTCSTTSCLENDQCDPKVKSFGYWKKHFPDAWPTSVIDYGLTIGCTFYTADDLEAILNTTPAKGQCNIALLHQVINTRLNIINGASQAYIDATAADLAAAEALLCGGSGDCGALTKALDGERAQFECTSEP